MARGRRKAWLVFAAVAVLAAVWLLARLWPEPRPGAPGDAADGAPPPPRTSMAARPPHDPSPLPPSADDAAPEPEAELGPGRTVPAPLPPPPTLPPDTQALVEELRPGTSDWDEVPVSEAGHRLRIMPRRYNVIVPEPIVLLVELREPSGARGRLDGARVSIRSLDHDGPTLERSAFDDGRGGDEARGDLLYTATFALGPTDRAAVLGRVAAEASVVVPGVGRREVHTTLIYTVGPRAKVAGGWRDWKEGGHLFVEAQVEVDEPGSFALMAQVFGPSLEPIAWVRAQGDLGAGKHPMVLRVWGPLLRERGIDGPYRIREVLLTREKNERGDYDPGPTIEEAWRTAPYRAAEFSGTPYESPEAAPVPEGIYGARPGEPPALHSESERTSAGGKAPKSPPVGGSPASAAPAGVDGAKAPAGPPAAP